MLLDEGRAVPLSPPHPTSLPHSYQPTPPLSPPPPSVTATSQHYSNPPSLPPTQPPLSSPYPQRDGETALKVWNGGAVAGEVAVFNVQGAAWDRTRRKFMRLTESPAQVGDGYGG